MSKRYFCLAGAVLAMALPAAAKSKKAVRSVASANSAAHTSVAVAHKSSSFAEFKARNEMTIRPTLGATFNQHVGDVKSSAMDSGITAGAMVSFGKGTNIVETGLLFSQFNSKENKVTVQQDYLGIPVIGKVFMENSARGFFLRYGGTLDFLMGARTKGDGQTNGVQSSFNDYDLQANIGFGYSIPGDKYDLVLDVSGNRSLLSINAGNGGNIYNQAILVNAGVSL